MRNGFSHPAAKSDTSCIHPIYQESAAPLLSFHSWVCQGRTFFVSFFPNRAHGRFTHLSGHLSSSARCTFALSCQSTLLTELGAPERERESISNQGSIRGLKYCMYVGSWNNRYGNDDEWGRARPVRLDLRTRQDQSSDQIRNGAAAHSLVLQLCCCFG